MLTTAVTSAGRSIEQIKAVLNAAPIGDNASTLRMIDIAIDTVAPDLQRIMQGRFDETLAVLGMSSVGSGSASTISRNVMQELVDIENPAIARWVDRMLAYPGMSDNIRATQLIDYRGLPASADDLVARKAFAVRFATHELRTAELLHRVKGAAPATWTVTEGRGAQGAFDDAVAAAQSVATRNPHANFADRLTDPEFIASSRRVLATSSELPAGYHVDTSDKTIKTLTDMLSS